MNILKELQDFLKNSTTMKEPKAGMVIVANGSKYDYKMLGEKELMAIIMCVNADNDADFGEVIRNVEQMRLKVAMDKEKREEYENGGEA